MTLLRRAPREVYRVYAEDEYFASVALDEGFEAHPSGADRRLLRFVGGAMLVAAVGAVGGLIAITSGSSAPHGGRRVSVGLLAAAGSLASSRIGNGHAWQQPAGGDGAAQRAAPIRRSRPSRAASRASAGIASTEVASPAVAAPMAMTASAASASAAPTAPRAGRSEFGFER